MSTAPIKNPEGGDRLPTLFDFQWLMAGMGWWVDPSRLQNDKAYRDDCLRRALLSDSELQRKCRVQLLGPQRSSDSADAVVGVD